MGQTMATLKPKGRGLMLFFVSSPPPTQAYAAFEMPHRNSRMAERPFRPKRSGGFPNAQTPHRAAPSASLRRPLKPWPHGSRRRTANRPEQANAAFDKRSPYRPAS